MSYMLNFSVGCALTKEASAVLIINFNRKERAVLTSWGRDMYMTLLHMLCEYMVHLGTMEATAHTGLQQVEPRASIMEIADAEAAGMANVVIEANGSVNRNNDFSLWLKLSGGSLVEIVLPPQYAEWLIEYIGFALNDLKENNSSHSAIL